MRRRESLGLDRWPWIWHSAFYAVLLGAIGFALFDADESWGVRGGALGLALGLVVWHALGILAGFNRRSLRLGYWSIGYIAVGWVIGFVLAAMREDYQLVAIGLFSSSPSLP